MYDVAVVGAGPSGSFIGYRLASKGLKVAILEEHNEVGRPVECTGVVTRRVFQFVKSDSIANTVHGARIFFPGSSPIHITKGEETVVIYRDSFDKDVAQMAIDAGADLFLGSRVSDLSRIEEGFRINFRRDGETDQLDSRLVVGADGANSIVRKTLHGEKPKTVVSTFQADVPFQMDSQDDVDVYLGDEVTRGFFAWAVPTGDITRVGVGTLGSGAKEFFQTVCRKYGYEGMLGITGGPIPIRYLSRTYGYRYILVGDAAGIVKPLTGGGIYTGIVSANEGARAIIEAFDRDDMSESSLSRYQKYWKAVIGRELSTDGIAQRLFSMLGDRGLQWISRILSNKRMIDVINTYGDIDYPSRLIFRMVARNPAILLSLLTGL